ncbi:MAG TPA: SpoIIE family protein phosphatase [Gaiellaceae bacterium]|jgi:serine phosphatase RsbU (regulator of sigma subunit)|nr:SpoIIE family protein phosphatase [Gaiellaceae bacterium]
MALVRDTSDVAGLDQALAEIVEQAARLTEADVVVARLGSDGSGLIARAVYASSAALQAELEGSRISADSLSAEGADEVVQLPRRLRLVADKLGATAVLLLPIRVGGALIGSLELMRRRGAFDDRARALAHATAGQVALARRAFGEGADVHGSAPDLLELAGDALAAGSDEARAADQVAALAGEATGAQTCLLWRYETEGPVLVALWGPTVTAAPVVAHDALRRARASTDPISTERLEDGLGGGSLATLQLGQPPLGALQLAFGTEREPDDAQLARLGTFAVRAAHALRASERRRTLAVELVRTRALLTVVGQAIAELSLAHTLETAVERVCELFGVDRLAVYLVEDEGGALEPAAARGLAGPHVPVGQRLLELALGPARAHGILHVPDAAADPRLAGVRDALEEVGLEAAVAVPLRAREELVGLLAVYPERGRDLTENEESLLRALGAQLAVAVQNAALHERAERLGAERKEALDAEREAAKRLRALYEISRSFAESLSLDATFEAVARTIVESLDVDAAALRMPDRRGTSLVPVAVHVREDRLTAPLRAVLSLPQPLSLLHASVFRNGQPRVLDPESAGALGPAHEPLAPFLEKGSSAAVIPLTTQAEILGTLTLLSLDADRPIAGDTLDAAVSVAGQAALALDNARLYQQQKEFADSMQRSLLPRTRPQLAGLEVGVVYDSSARVDVGGDVYDFLELADGRLAVVLGDVTGHGIDAAADMAMAKFVFRSLAREHSEPGEFLAAANEIVLEEIEPGKFITLLYLTVDAGKGELACASGGHPRPRLLRRGGTPEPLDVGGLALGIEGGQQYEEARVRLEPGDAVALFTDGLVEARRDGELYGEQRLDDALTANAGLPAQELADALLADCFAFGGELADDCAIVVLKKRG